MRELSRQSSNGTYTEEDRQAMQADIDFTSVRDMASIEIDGITFEFDTNGIQSIENSVITDISAAVNHAGPGAAQNRLEHTMSELGNRTENLSSAESRIRDIDMAREMMGYVKDGILTQAAQAMLTQANHLPEDVLQLIK